MYLLARACVYTKREGSVRVIALTVGDPLVKILAPGFYARQDIKTPVKIGIVTLWFGMGTEQSWLTSSGWSRILRLAALVVEGVVIYFSVLGLLGFRLKNFSRRAVS